MDTCGKCNKPAASTSFTMLCIGCYERELHKDVVLKKKNAALTAENERLKERVAELESEDILDWEARIKTAPPRPSGKLRVKLRYVGRSKPSGEEGDDDA